MVTCMTKLVDAKYGFGLVYRVLTLTDTFNKYLSLSVSNVLEFILHGSIERSSVGFKDV